MWVTVQEAYGGARGSLESLYSLFWGALLGVRLGDGVQPQLCFSQMGIVTPGEGGENLGENRVAGGEEGLCLPGSRSQHLPAWCDGWFLGVCLLACLFVEMESPYGAL